MLWEIGQFMTCIVERNVDKEQWAIDLAMCTIDYELIMHLRCFYVPPQVILCSLLYGRPIGEVLVLA
jgi:hypothetical protein